MSVFSNEQMALTFFPIVYYPYPIIHLEASAKEGWDNIWSIRKEKTIR